MRRERVSQLQFWVPLALLVVLLAVALVVVLTTGAQRPLGVAKGSWVLGIVTVGVTALAIWGSMRVASNQARDTYAAALQQAAMSHELQLQNEARRSLVGRLDGSYRWLLELHALVSDIEKGAVDAAPEQADWKARIEWCMTQLQPLDAKSEDADQLVAALREYQPHFSLSDKLIELVERLIKRSQSIRSDARFSFITAAIAPEQAAGDSEPQDYRQHLKVLYVAMWVIADLKVLIEYVYLSAAFSARGGESVSPPALFKKQDGQWVYNAQATPAMKKLLRSIETPSE